MQRNRNRQKKPITLQSIGRWFKLKYLLLTRAKGGASIVAIGFAIGLFVEMFTLPTAGLAFFLIFPLVYVLRGSMAGALIGFVFGKVIYIPMSFLNKRVGDLLMPREFLHGVMRHAPDWLMEFLRFNLKLIVGGMVDGLALACISYFPIRWILILFEERRKEKRKRRKAQLMLSSDT
ncbi:DUF2062 domain-containing protein [Paenibacillus thalictri]|uniref:DUF2062 domain-containing protein n=1 Tax=Paenibacillus thalictri TaxID=2527873 RepID=A0A4Q9DH80_9BACL|nr:DUF2062 domain-containing protein [Paenibacillus thalictri]TBL70060.1 DUF2062 domain-containing protein [Paenibacillus thalictri]